MAYEPTIWKNREVEKPRTFQEQNNPDGTVTLIPKEGNVIEPGTPIIADTMNKIELGIKEAHDMAGGVDDLQDVVATHMADYLKHTGYAVATGSANTYIATLNPALSVYQEGVSLRLKINIANTGASTVNVNGLGAKTIKKSNGNAVASENLKLGSVYTLAYDGTSFILQGEGGEYGTAIASQVLAPNTIGTENGVIPGTMPNRGSFNLGLGASVPAGYYSGGTAPNGKRWASGTMRYTIQSSEEVIYVSGIGFLPSRIIVTEINSTSANRLSVYWEGKVDKFYRNNTLDGTALRSRGNGNFTMRVATGTGADFDWIAFE